MYKHKVVVISGGTISPIRPHFALCAPAYGKIGTDIVSEFVNSQLPYERDNYLDVIGVKTKMAGGSDIETTFELYEYIKEVLLDNDVKCVIMAAAVCDFHVENIITDGQNDYDIGKEYPRLSSGIRNENSDVINRNLLIYPAYKVVEVVKKMRPDITLVTFKTTSDTTEDDLYQKCALQAKGIQADFVFGNDIATKTNMLVSNAKELPHVLIAERKEIISVLVRKLIEKLNHV